jgi:putative ABC transport system substrate-binding protein
MGRACIRSARAPTTTPLRRIGIILPASADDAEYQAWVGAFLRALALLGWTIGRNVRIDTHWATTDAAEIRKHAAELAAVAPDVVLAHGASTVGPLLQATSSVPIVFPTVVDPVGAGLIDGLARPGGNATGFMAFEYSIGGKWLEQLKQIAPALTRVAVLRDSATPTGLSQFGVIQAVALSLRMEVNPVDTRDAGEIERAVADHHAGSPAQAACGLLRPLLRGRRRLDFLWARSDRPVSTRGRLCQSHPQGRAAGRPASAGGDQVRVGDQPQDR